MNTEKKNQHFVPKFYLRNFSIRQAGKQLAVFNTQSDQWIPNASLKGQAQKNFFYGKDGKIEDHLGQTENEVAPLLKKITFENHVPLPGSDDHLRVLHFLMLTHLRNPVNTNDITSRLPMLNEHIKKMSGNEVSIDPTKMTTHDQAIQMALKHLPQAVAVSKDLRLKLMINLTKIPFITSDYPVIRYNQFMEMRKWPLSGIGMANVGLQIFMPLSPTVMLITYDDMTYKIGDKKKNIVNIIQPGEVDQLNTLQLLNCDRNLFGNEKLTKDYLMNLKVRAARLTKANTPTMKEVELHTDQGVSRIINSSNTECRISLSLSAVNQTKSAKRFVFSTKAVHVRERTKGILTLLHGPGW
ncbi:MAG: DUF4238 domain-containing protein [Bacteroidetes bacterium]|nr:DUF4238 domain-containing protein [Bacteroidota bacterium]